jgi:hypothetical protein
MKKHIGVSGGNSMIRFIGGLWRVMDGGVIKSFTTYADAAAYVAHEASEPAWEDCGPLFTSDDIHQHLYK